MRQEVKKQPSRQFVLCLSGLIKALAFLFWKSVVLTSFVPNREENEK
jgi:hypothetical protein